MRKLIRALYPTEVEFHRFEHCVNYSDCLLEAGRRKWVSFSCRGCEEFCKMEDLQTLPILASGTQDYVYPPSDAFGGDLPKFSKKLTDMMRRLKIPIMGDKGDS